MRALERFLLLQIIDQRWQEHLYDMDYLREGIHLRGFAQIEPLVAYKNEAFDAVPGPDEQRLGRLRAADLPRPGDAARTPTAVPPPPPAARPSPASSSATGGGRVTLLGRHRAAGAQAMAAAAGRRGPATTA